jgi:hypothetical protein
MPLKKAPPVPVEKEPIENLKDLIGFKWSSIINFLLGLIPTAAVAGFLVGKWVANSDNKIEINSLTLKHSQELYKATEDGRKKGLEEYKKLNSESETFLKLIKEAQKNEK